MIGGILQLLQSPMEGSGRFLCGQGERGGDQSSLTEHRAGEPQKTDYQWVGSLEYYRAEGREGKSGKFPPPLPQTGEINKGSQNRYFQKLLTVLDNAYSLALQSYRAFISKISLELSLLDGEPNSIFSFPTATMVGSPFFVNARRS